GLEGGQGLLGLADIKGLIGLDRRVLVRAAQWAGFAGLQLQPVVFQRLNLALLLQQFFLVTQFLANAAVLLAQREQLSLFCRLPSTALLQRGLTVDYLLR